MLMKSELKFEIITGLLDTICITTLDNMYVINIY